MLDFVEEEFPGLDESKKCDPSTLPFASRYNFKKKPVKPGKNIKLTCKDGKKNPKKTKFVKCKVAKDENGNKLGAYFELNADVKEFYDDCSAGCSLGQFFIEVFLVNYFLDQKRVVDLFGITLETNCDDFGPGAVFLNISSNVF